MKEQIELPEEKIRWIFESNYCAAAATYFVSETRHFLLFSFYSDTAHILRLEYINVMYINDSLQKDNGYIFLTEYSKYEKSVKLSWITPACHFRTNMLLLVILA